MPRHIELNPVTQFTVGTIGRPGQRTFYLQGSKGSNTVSLVIEKQQAAMLADSPKMSQSVITPPELRCG